MIDLNQFSITKEIRRRVMRSALWLSVLSFITLLIGVVANERHSQTFIMTTTMAGAPFLHMLLAVALIGLGTSLFGAGIWAANRTLHQMWFYRYIFLLAVEAILAFYGAIIGSTIMNKRQVLFSQSAYNKKLQAEILTGTILLLVNCIADAAYIVSLMKARRLFIIEVSRHACPLGKSRSCPRAALESIRGFFGLLRLSDPYLEANAARLQEKVDEELSTDGISMTFEQDAECSDTSEDDFSSSESAEEQTDISETEYNEAHFEDIERCQQPRIKIIDGETTSNSYSETAPAVRVIPGNIEYSVPARPVTPPLG